MAKLALEHDSGVMAAIIFSYSKTPEDILLEISYSKDFKNIFFNKNGEIGITIDRKNFKVGEYRFIASKEHSFNALVCCFYGPERYNIDYSHDDQSVFYSASFIPEKLEAINYEGTIGAKFFVTLDATISFLDISFGNSPIAQQVYDSDFWTPAIGMVTTSNTPPEWFLAAQQESKSTGGCYVATAVYGSYDCPQVWTLRRYRDYALAKTWWGRAFIHIYYAISPSFVKYFGNLDWFKNLLHKKLDSLVRKLQENGYNSQPYEDRE